MKWSSCLFVLSLVASVQFGGSAWAQADTLEVMGPSTGDWGIAWWGNTWNGTGFCGDTINRDSGTVVECFESDFIPDTGGLTEGAFYINYVYKMRQYWAQLPVKWSGWRGMDATGHNALMVVYKGLLPVHQMELSFFYGYAYDTLKNFEKHGDGVGILAASPTEWKTAILPLADSIDLEGITGVSMGISNAPGKGDSVSEAGTIKIARIAFIGPDPATVKYGRSRSASVNSSVFTPAGGKVELSLYSLKGEVLMKKAVTVQAGMRYTVGGFVRKNCGAMASQVRFATIKGDGVNATTRIW